MRKILYIVYLTLIFGAFQNCAPTHMESALTSGLDTSSVSEDQQLAEKFTRTLQPVLLANCARCHGLTQNPKFAVIDPESAVTVIREKSLVSFTSAQQSKFVLKIKSGHNGFTNELALQVEAGIQAWINSLGEVPADLDISAPAVLVTEPAADANLAGDVTLSADASDDIGVIGVQFLVDGNPVGTEDLTAPYSVTIPTLPDGAHAIRARARDAAGNSADSAPVNITVYTPVADAVLPTASITSPANNAQVSATITVAITAADNIGVLGVTLYVDGTAYGAEDTTAPYTVALNTVALTNGNHSLTARARDAAGNVGISAARTIAVNNLAPDTMKPTVSITAPTAASTVSATVNITANAADNVGVVGVQFYVNGAPSGAEDTAAPYSVAWNTTAVTNGNYQLTARARDAAGNMTTSAAVTVAVSNASANPMATYTYISQNILPKCTGCHSGAGAAAGVRYDSYTATIRTARAGNLAGSLLYTETANGSMPRGGNNLSATELKAISDWIAAGTPNN